MEKYKKFLMISLLVGISLVAFTIALNAGLNKHYEFYNTSPSQFVPVGDIKKDAIEVEVVENNILADETVTEEKIEDDIEDDDTRSVLEVEEEAAEKNSEDQEKQTELTGEVSIAAPTTKYPFSPLPQPIFREKSPDEIRVGFITDLHAESKPLSGGGRIIKQVFVDRINAFLEKMNNVFVPDFIIVNGDIIDGTKVSSSKGSQELALLKKTFNRTIINTYWVLGNHDLRSVDKKLWQKSLGIDYLVKSFEIGDYRIIILDSNFTKDDTDVKPHTSYTRGRVSADQLAWLEKELENTDKRPIVFIHHPPFWGNDETTNLGRLNNAPDLEKIFSRHKVLAVFSGHVEDLHIKEIDGVRYHIFPGIVKNERYPGAFFGITIKNREIFIEMSYLLKNGEYQTAEIKE